MQEVVYNSQATLQRVSLPPLGKVLVAKIVGHLPCHCLRKNWLLGILSSATWNLKKKKKDGYPKVKRFINRTSNLGCIDILQSLILKFVSTTPLKSGTGGLFPWLTRSCTRAGLITQGHHPRISNSTLSFPSWVNVFSTLFRDLQRAMLGPISLPEATTTHVSPSSGNTPPVWLWSPTSCSSSSKNRIMPGPSLGIATVSSIVKREWAKEQ